MLPTVESSCFKLPKPPFLLLLFLVPVLHGQTTDPIWTQGCVKDVEMSGTCNVTASAPNKYFVKVDDCMHEATAVLSLPIQGHALIEDFTTVTTENVDGTQPVGAYGMCQILPNGVIAAYTPPEGTTKVVVTDPNNYTFATGTELFFEFMVLDKMEPNAVNCGGQWSIFPGYEINPKAANNCSFGVKNSSSIYTENFGGIIEFYEGLGKSLTEGCLAQNPVTSFTMKSVTRNGAAFTPVPDFKTQNSFVLNQAWTGEYLIKVGLVTSVDSIDWENWFTVTIYEETTTHHDKHHGTDNDDRGANDDHHHGADDHSNGVDNDHGNVDYHYHDSVHHRNDYDAYYSSGDYNTDNNCFFHNSGEHDYSNVDRNDFDSYYHADVHFD